MSPLPKLSVVIATYNRADLLVEALESVKRQTLPPYEVIVADDGSTDETREVCAAYGVRYLWQENRGAPAARNLALRHVSGDAAVFLDSDDRLLPDALAQLVEGWRRAIDDAPATGVVYGQRILFREDGYRKKLRSPHATLDTLLRSHVLAPSGTLVTRECLERVQGFDEGCLLVDDWEYWLRIALAGFEFYRLRRVIYEYRDHPAGISKNEEKTQEGRLEVHQRLLQEGQLDARQTRVVKREMAKTLLKLRRFQYHFGQGDERHLEGALAQDAGIVREPWLFVMAGLYVVPSLRGRCRQEPIEETLAVLKGEIVRRVSVDGAVPPGLKRRLDASAMLALAVDALGARRYPAALRALARSVLRDPTLIGAALSSSQAEIFHAIQLL